MSNADEAIEKKPTVKETNGIPKEELPLAPKSESESSDNGSQDSQLKRPQRRHQREGRKPIRASPSPDSHKPWSERYGRLEDQFPPSSQPEGTIKAPPKPIIEEDKATENGLPKPFETGLKTFNIRSLDPSLGDRPIGVSVEGGRPSTKTKKSKKEKKKKKKRKPKKEDSDEESSSSSDSDDEKQEKRRPLAIRLDLNLELEIFLRAKVKGDVTITFL